MRIELDKGKRKIRGRRVIEHKPAVDNFPAGIVSRPETGVLVTVVLDVIWIELLVGNDETGRAARVQFSGEYTPFSICSFTVGCHAKCHRPLDCAPVVPRTFRAKIAGDVLTTDWYC